MTTVGPDESASETPGADWSDVTDYLSAHIPSLWDWRELALMLLMFEESMGLTSTVYELRPIDRGPGLIPHTDGRFAQN